MEEDAVFDDSNKITVKMLKRRFVYGLSYNSCSEEYLIMYSKKIGLE